MMMQTLAIVACLSVAADHALACPFCQAQSQTLSEEIATMDAAVIAKLASPPRPEARGGVTQAKFAITDVVVNSGALKPGQTFETVYFGSAKPGAVFLVMGVDPPNLTWSTPLPLTARSAGYVQQIVKLPKEGPSRLAFFQKYLEDEEELLARDAYDEFARAPYGAVLDLKPHMDRPQLVRWISDLDIPASRRRLYFTMLGVCGTPEDVGMLEKMLKSNDRRMRAGLDAMIACYLTLKGPEGMPLVEELFLKDPETEYSDTYAAIMALRFHGTEVDVVPRERILQGLHHMLERPPLADLVIPDLARWEDWSQIDKLVKLFKEADEKSSWVKVPVINYLRACPLPEAKARLAELKKIDPETVERANNFFPFGIGAKPSEGSGNDSGQSAPAANQDTRVTRPRGDAVASQEAAISVGGAALGCVALCGLGLAGWLGRTDSAAAA